MRVRAGGSKWGLDSRTRTRRPPRARAAAVYRPAAEPPTTITSPFSRDERESLDFFATVWYAPTTRVTWKLQEIAAQNELVTVRPLGNYEISGIGRPGKV